MFELLTYFFWITLACFYIISERERAKKSSCHNNCLTFIIARIYTPQMTSQSSKNLLFFEIIFLLHLQPQNIKKRHKFFTSYIWRDKSSCGCHHSSARQFLKNYCDFKQSDNGDDDFITRQCAEYQSQKFWYFWPVMAFVRPLKNLLSIFLKLNIIFTAQVFKLRVLKKNLMQLDENVILTFKKEIQVGSKTFERVCR